MQAKAEVYNIFYDAVAGCVVMEWNGYATSAQFKEGTELMLNTLVQNKATKVLADIKDMVLIGREDQEWLDTHFLPRATQFGFKALAIIRPEHYFNKVAVESISYKVDKDKLAINFFDNLEEAKGVVENIVTALPFQKALYSFRKMVTVLESGLQFKKSVLSLKKAVYSLRKALSLDTALKL